MEPREIEIRTETFRYAARRWGRADGPPVLALHGWLDTAASFDLLAPHLGDFDLVALDLLGHGLSDPLPEGTVHHLVDRVVNVVEVLEALGWTNAAILGHSLGASIGCHLAGAFPSLVSRLVLIEGIGALSREPEECPTVLRDSYRQEKGLKEKRRAALREPEELFGALRRSRRLDDASARVLARRAIETGEEGARFRHDLRCELSPRDRFVESQVLAYLEAIACPVLLLMARGNRYLQEEPGASMFRARCDRIGDLTLRLVEGGHYPHLTHPEVVGPEAASFLASPADERTTPTPP